MTVELEPFQSLVLVLTGIAAGFANVVAAGGSLLTVPALILLGLPEGVANGTSRVAILVQNAVAIWRYQGQGQLNVGLALGTLLPALFGAGLGALGATAIDGASFRVLFGWVMLGCALWIVWNPGAAAVAGVRAGSEAPAETSALTRWLVLFGIGLYGGLIQAGVGYLILAALPRVLRVSLVQANVLKVVIVAAYMPLAIAVFWWDGQLALWPALCLMAGQAVGAWLGVQEVLRRGEKLIRVMLVVSVVAGAGELLGVY